VNRTLEGVRREGCEAPATARRARRVRAAARARRPARANATFCSGFEEVSGALCDPTVAQTEDCVNAYSANPCGALPAACVDLIGC